MLPTRASILLLLVSTAGCAAANHARSPGGSEERSPEPGAECSLEEVFARPLVLEGGGHLSVAPVALAASGEDVLLAGWPSYLFKWDASGTPRLLSTDSILGAVIGKNGSARLIPSPIPARLIDDVRVLGRGDGTWDVIIPELILHPEGTFPRTDTIARLWHGVYDGTAWTSLDEIPIPDGTTLVSKGISELVRAGDTLSVAVRTGPGRERNVVVLSRRSDGWTAEVIRTGWAGFLTLAYGPGTGLVLAAPRTDDTGRGGSMSLFIYTRNPKWSAPHLVDRGELPVHSPVLANSNGRMVLAWYADDEATGRFVVRGLDDPLDSPLDHAVLLDSSYASMRAVGLVSTPAGTFWVITHRAPGRERSELRVLHGTARHAREIARIPHPFVMSGSFRVASIGDSELLISGPIVQDGIVVSHLVRTRVRCAPMTREGPARNR